MVQANVQEVVQEHVGLFDLMTYLKYVYKVINTIDDILSDMLLINNSQKGYNIMESVIFFV
jgi:hypothetical protein